MILGKVTLAMCLLSAPAVWAQFNRADMMKLATDRLETAVTTLKLNPDQVASIKPLLQSKYVDIGQIKDVYKGSVKSDTSKKDAKESLRSINDKYNAQITTILTPEQVKQWRRMLKDWKDDLIVPKS